MKAFALDGQLLGEVVLEGGGFVNDVAVTADAAYGTDSYLQVLYKWPFLEDGALGALETIPLSGDYVHVDGGETDMLPPINSNGIVANADGSWLLIVNSANGDLYKVT
jgi:sugar lactone lactonase YvrE